MKELIIRSLGLDPGNGFIKVKTSSHEVIEPLVYANISNIHNYNNFDCVAEIDDVRYIIGEEAANSGFEYKPLLGENDLSRYSDFFYRIMATFIIKNYSFKSNKVIVQNLVLGLPNNIFNKLSKEVTSKLKKSSISIVVNNKLKTLDISNVKVVPQPFGTYYSSEEYIGKDVYVVDYGFGTVDYTYFKNNNLVENFGTTNGIRKALVTIQKNLEEEYNGISLTPHKVLDIIQSKSIRYGGEDIELSTELLDTLLSYNFETILDEIIARHNNLAAINLVVFSGGASTDMKNYIEKLNLKNVIVAEDPQMSNAKGYYNIGCSLWKWSK